MKVTLELSPASYLRLLNHSPVDSRFYATLINGCSLRRDTNGDLRSVFQIVSDKAEAIELHEFARNIDLHAASEIAASAGLNVHKQLRSPKIKTLRARKRRRT